MKRNLLGILIVAIFTLSLIPSTAFAYGSNTVSQSEAKAAASYLMEQYESQFTAWDSAKLGETVAYYSIDNSLIAYEFTVLNEDGAVGYLIISATKDLPPMLECSGNKSPSSYIEDANKLAAEKGYDVNGENPRILYWGGLTYSVQFGEQMREKGIAIHLPTGVITQVPEKIDLQIDNDQARIEWNKLDLLLNNKGSTESTRGTVIISDVPAWWQDSYNGGVGDDGDDEEAEYPDCAGPYDDPWDAWDGCSPISGAMIHGYWSLMGYDEIPYAEEWLIDDNHYYMDTNDSGVTNPLLIDNGIRDVFEYLYGYEDCFEVNNTSGTNWSDITSQVNAGNPAVMSFVGGTFNQHSSTLVGYEDNDMVDYIILHDTWGWCDHYLVYGDWLVCQMTKVEEC